MSRPTDGGGAGTGGNDHGDCPVKRERNLGTTAGGSGMRCLAFSEQEREIVSSLSNQKIIKFLKANNGPLTEEKETKEEPTEKPAETEVKEEAPVKKTRKPRAKKTEEKPAEEAK